MSRLATVAILSLWLPSPALCDQTISATDPAFVTRFGRTFNYTGGNSSGVGLSYLGGAVRVAYTGKVLRATFAPSPKSYKVSFQQSDEGYRPWQGVSWVAGTGIPETVVVGTGGGSVLLTLNDPPQYWGGRSGAVLSFSTDGAFSPAEAPPTRVLHLLGVARTAWVVA